MGARNREVAMTKSCGEALARNVDGGTREDEGEASATLRDSGLGLDSEESVDRLTDANRLRGIFNSNMSPSSSDIEVMPAPLRFDVSFRLHVSL